MIPSDGRHEVSYWFTREDGSRHSYNDPLIAWDDNGGPLVAGPSGLTTPRPRYYNASAIGKYDRWEVVPAGRFPLTTFVDGQGWMLEVTWKEGDDPETYRVIAWGCRDDDVLAPSAVPLCHWGPGADSIVDAFDPDEYQCHAWRLFVP